MTRLNGAGVPGAMVLIHQTSIVCWMYSLYRFRMSLFSPSHFTNDVGLLSEHECFLEIVELPFRKDLSLQVYTLETELKVKNCMGQYVRNTCYKLTS